MVRLDDGAEVLVAPATATSRSRRWPGMRRARCWPSPLQNGDAGLVDLVEPVRF